MVDFDLPDSVSEPSLIVYRSIGIGVFGMVMRFAGMPLEKIALFANSSQVSGKNQFQQAVNLTFREGMVAPYRVVGSSSLVAWFLQYSVMGFAFQFFDRGLSTLMGVRPAYYGKELMEPPSSSSRNQKDASLYHQSKFAAKSLLAPVLASCIESSVSNRAEVERFFGPEKFRNIETSLNANSIRRMVGPAFLPSAARNVIMCQTTFLLTPMTYKLYFPQEQKSQTSLFWYGLGLNAFVGNVVAITQQALWGRSLDYLAQNGSIKYKHVVQQGFEKEGIPAFFTFPKWGSRVLMNAPAQGALPWFYNDVLPHGETTILSIVHNFIYEPFFK